MQNVATFSLLRDRAYLLLFLLVFSATWLNASQTYILSYRAEIKNAIVISESFHLSKAMTQITSTPKQSLKLYSPKESNLQKIMHTHKDKVLEFLMKEGVHTRSYEKTYNLKSSSIIFLTLPPTYITVDFNDDYATITRLILK